MESRIRFRSVPLTHRQSGAEQNETVNWFRVMERDTSLEIFLKLL